eukprot:CAMPEP_0182867030 /NCGR_PEP_ID=MMETSP0034_2-20130328/8506_1 /TAXON_ID=156128 /ORGANISM="Nephroselmis pyriformis, Strain CCMP717" /LENGTH=83 /DNA_ID=CAMNT_0024999363 /DNA_START=247 /DNA_END=498 /DNA_ORIENTATION=+
MTMMAPGDAQGAMNCPPAIAWSPRRVPGHRAGALPALLGSPSPLLVEALLIAILQLLRDVVAGSEEEWDRRRDGEGDHDGPDD